MSNGTKVLLAASGLAAIILTFGLGIYVAFLNYPQQQRYQAYQYTAEEPTKSNNAVSSPSKSLEYREPCKDPKGKDESGLCAQWRATNAAEESALFARWGFWVGIGGMIGLFWTLYYNRAAVRDAGEATKAVLRQTEIAERTQRPWITIEIEMKAFYAKDRHKFTFNAIMKNVGQSVAEQFSFYYDIGYLRPGYSVVENFIDGVPSKAAGSKVVIAPNDSYVLSVDKVTADHEVHWIPETNAVLEHCVPVIMFGVFYKGNAIQPDWHHSIKCFELTGKAGPISRYTTRLLQDEFVAKPATGHIAT